MRRSRWTLRTPVRALPATYRPRPHRFRPDIEGLRGVAILLVVAHHVGLPVLTGGFVGVDVFFALSGFLITGLLLDELTTAGRVDLWAFYARRTRRLLPAALTVLATTLVLAALVYSPAQIGAVASSTQAAAAFVSNVALAARATDYFGPNVDALPLLHTWSLSVEEQFYLVWPALVWLAAGRAASRPRLRATLLLVTVVSLGACWWFTFTSRPTAFYGTPTRAWEFALGALGALAAVVASAPPGRGSLRTLAVASGWGGLALVLGAAVAFTGRTMFPGVHAVVPALGTALVVLGAAGTARGSVGAALAAPWLQWVGRHSYAWYLWHWPLLVLGAELLPDASLATRVGVALAALALSVVTRVWIEEPCRRAAVLARHPRLTVSAGLAGVLLFVGSAEVLRRRAEVASSAPSQRAYTAAIKDRPRVYADDCSPPLGDSTATACDYGERGARTTVLLVGDSHAAHWFPALESLARTRGWHLVVLTKSACPMVDVSLFEPVLGRTFRECDAWRRAALDTVRARRPDLVLVSNSAEYVTGGARPEPRASVTAEQWERGVAGTLGALRRAGLRAAVMQDVPFAPASIPECLRRADWRGRPPSRCDFSLAASVHAGAARAVTRAAATLPGVRVLDLTAAMCPDGRCPAMADGAVRYRDARHLTGAAALGLAPALDAALAGAGLIDDR